MKTLRDTVAAIVVFVVTVAAFVYLTASGKETAGLLTLTGPILAALWAVSAVKSTAEDQNKVINTIAENTNGKLDARIEQAVTRVLDARGGG